MPWAYIPTKDKFDGPIFGQESLYKGGAYIWEEICNLLNIIFFLSSSIKHVTRHFLRRARFEVCSKLTIKTLEYVYVTIKFKIKTALTSFWPLYFLLWTHFTSCYSVSIVDFDQLIAGCGCCLLLWRFAPAGINLCNRPPRFNFHLWRNQVNKLHWQNAWKHLRKSDIRIKLVIL